MTITNTGRRIALLGLLALVAALIPFTGASAAHLDGEVTQIPGDNNADAAIGWSQVGAYPDGGLESGARDPQRVLIGRDNLFPDNLASGALQGSDDTGSDGPLLLTATDELYDSVSDEIERLATNGDDDTTNDDEIEVIILGEFEAISEAVEQELADHENVSSVERLGGPTRIETAIEVTQENDSNVALLARAYDADGGSSPQAYVDSLAAGAWAADADYGVLLTQTDVLTPSTEDFLTSGDQVDEVIIIGGTDAVSQDVEDAVKAILGDDNVSREGGSNRWDTAVEIAEARGFDSSADAEGIILSEGANENEEGQDTWADGLPAAATSALEDYPVLLSNDDTIPPETAAFAEFDTDSDDALVCGPYVNTTACDQFAALTTSGDTSSDEGVIVDFDTENDTYTFAGTGGQVTVEYDAENADITNLFTVDGEDADLEDFELALSIGDGISVFVNEQGDAVVQFHELQNDPLP